mmetsp:Transcript_40479/g.90791  ORF Transcript_40479/g.90791 Transcript_40479/m.90791 type:complete len:1106 (+) Transcript_40479:42-3359(+)
MARLRPSGAGLDPARVTRNMRSMVLCSTTCAVFALLAITMRRAPNFTLFRFSAASAGRTANAPLRHLSLGRYAEGTHSAGNVMVRPAAQEEQAGEENNKKASWTLWDSPPRIFSWVKGYKKLLRQKQLQVPGHLKQRQWRQKGRKDGYVIVPFPFAARSIVPDPEIPICLVGRRERQRNFLNMWQAQFDDLLAFDIQGTVTPEHLDPIEPPVDWPLDKRLPSKNEIYEQVLHPARVGDYYRRKDTEVRTLVKKLKQSGGNGGVNPARLLQSVVSRLPKELLTEENQPLIRSSVEELLGLLWTVHSACGGLSERFRWRFACIDNEDADEEETKGTDAASPLTAIFVVAGDGVEFIPKPFVDEKREAREVGLTQSQLDSLSSEDWVQIEAKSKTNVTEALRRMPAGWTVLLKGDEWYGGKKGSRSAVWRMPSRGKRLIMQVEVLGKEAVKVAEPEVPTFSEIREGSTHKSDLVTTGKELLFMQSAVAGSIETMPPTLPAMVQEEATEEEGSVLDGLGPLAAIVAAVLAVLRKSAPYRFGQERRREYRSFIRSLQRLEDTSMNAMEATQELEQKLWMDFSDAAEAPVVLLIGGLTETGKVLSRKLILKGYHVVLLEDVGKRRRKYKWKIRRSVGRDTQGGIVAAVRANTQDIEWMTNYHDDVPEDLYNAVAGVDKMIICACDKDSKDNKSPTYSQLRGILAAWKEYRKDFSECNRSQASTLTLFSFKDEVSRSLWAVETRNPSDSCYGAQYAVWERNRYTGNAAMFQGVFFEEIAQATLLSPTLRLNFKSFSALMLSVYSFPDDGETSTTFSFILRTEDFDSTRVQYEFEFTVGEGYQTVRMPFVAFKAVRADGVEVPANEAQPLERTSLTQLGVVKRNSRRVSYDETSRRNRGERFNLDILRIGVSKTQVEPDVIYMGPLADGQDAVDLEEAADEMEEEEEPMSYKEQYEAMLAAEKAAEEELESVMAMADMSATAGLEVRRRSRKGVDPKKALIDSGLVYTILHMNGVNNHPGGKYPLTMSQLPVDAAPLSGHKCIPHAKFISRGDATELAMSSLTEPACRNAEVFIGELSTKATSSDSDMGPFHEMGPTSQDDVGSYLKKLSPSV